LVSNVRAAAQIPEPPIATCARVDGCKQAPPKGQYRQLTLLELDVLLTRYGTSRATIEDIAAVMLTDSIRANWVLERAAGVERQSGYVDYRLEHRNPDPILSGAGVYSRARHHSRHENKRIARLLPALEERLALMSLEDIELLREGLAVWSRTYRPAQYFNLATELGEVRVLEAVARLISPTVRLRIRTNSNATTAQESCLPAIGLPVEVAPIPSAHEKSRRRKFGRVAVQIAEPGDCQTVHTRSPSEWRPKCANRAC